MSSDAPALGRAMDKLFDNRSGVNVSDQGLSRVQQLAAELTDLDGEIASAEAMLEAANERHREIRHKVLPEVMLDIGIREFTTAAGTKIQLAFITDGSLGPARNAEELAAREAKIDCIIEHGGGEIVKQMITIEFPKEAIGAAEEIKQRLIKLFQTKKWGAFPVTIDRQRSINHQTLGSWIRERMSSGDANDQLPPSFFQTVGIWYGEAAKLIKPRKPKGEQ